MQVYESEQYLNEYLLFHYGEAADVLAWDFGPKDAAGFAARCVSECIEMGRSGRMRGRWIWGARWGARVSSWRGIARR